jgi:glycosyltransferase involved in cell wall biosynthesis
MVSWYGPQGKVLTGGNFHYDLAVELSKYCNCAIYYPYDRNISDWYSKKNEWGILTYRSKYALKNKIRNRVYMLCTMKKIVKEFKPDIIHGQVATEAGRFAVMLGRIFNIPVMITEHSAVEASGVKEFPHYWYAKNVYKYSSYNACVSDSLANNLKNIFPMYEFHTVYNGVKSIPISDERSKYRRDGYVNIVMVAGLYDRYIKGLQFSLPAIKRLINEGKNIVFHFVGDGEYLQEYKQMAQKLGIDNNCIFYGFCEKSKVYEIVSDMDFYLCASIFESFSCATVEALMLGKPVVATKCGGPESIVNNDNGILVDTGSEQSIYDGIACMIEIYDNYCSDRIKKEAFEKFSVENIAKQYITIYSNIIQNK